MVDVHGAPGSLSPLVARFRKLYLKHDLHPAVCEPISERFRNSNIAEPLLSIALLT
jgi:hypothetical protein